MWSYQMAGLNLRGVSMQDAEHMGQLSSSHAHLLSKKVKAAAMAAFVCCRNTLLTHFRAQQQQHQQL
jgi:hypothetical protein